MNFTETELHPDLIRAAQDAGFEQLTEIQEKCLIPALEGRDIAGISQTGTGKTVAFLLPILNNLFTTEKEACPSALIVTPTRELCVQIAEEAQKLSKQNDIKVCTIYGGESYTKQEEQLRACPDIIVATPGRLIDYLKQKKIDLSSIDFLVLDEADRMFDMGFIRDIRYIMKSAPPGVRTMLFSATLSYYVMRLASDFMKDPVEVRIESDSVAVEKIDQKLFHLGRNEKMMYLINFLLKEEELRVIVFTNLKNMVPVIVSNLRKYGIHATGLSSLLDQKKRIRLLKDFKLGHYSVLVATDVASRGLDVDDIGHVFNYDLPQDAESYVHRIGRTARAGKTGVSISFCSETDYEYLPRIERYLGNKIPVENVNPEYLKNPEGNFNPFIDEHDKTFHTKKPDAHHGHGRERQPGPDSRGKRRGPPGGRQEKREDKRPDTRTDNRNIKSDKKPPYNRKPARDESSGVSSVRAADRAALLEKMDRIRPGTAAKDYDKIKPYEESQARKRRGQSDSRRRDRDPGKAQQQGGSRGPRGDRKGGNASDRNRGGGRPDYRKGQERSSVRQPVPEKKGVFSKIASFFKKEKE